MHAVAVGGFAGAGGAKEELAEGHDDGWEEWQVTGWEKVGRVGGALRYRK